VGKRTCATAFAQVLLCHAPPGPDRACGACKSCRWLAAGKGLLCEHPDLLLPLKTTGGDERMIGDHEPLIALEPVQRLCERIHRSPANGPRRVAIVPEAHRLCRGQAESANAFLKTLEEPPAYATLVLTTSHPEA
jgi:DNA polymerase-3 subunit delta'